MTAKEKSGMVVKIETQHDRTLLHLDGRSFYYAIAKLDTDVQVGDTIVYESFGVNCGWFIRKKEKVNA